jgi:hypothetical protein
MQITRQQIRKIIREAMDRDAPYVLERSGVGWEERFFVEIASANAVTFGPFEQAEQFTDLPTAEKVQGEIDRIEGYFTRATSASFFKE